jgi:hypothetical protein
VQHQIIIGRTEQDIYGQVLVMSFKNFIKCPSGIMRAENPCDFPYSAALEIMEVGEQPITQSVRKPEEPASAHA